MKKNPNAHKLILDLVLVLALLTLFSKNVISLIYHEAVGTLLGLLFLVHLFFNRAWLKNVPARLFAGGLAPRARMVCLVNFLLTASWGVALFTGVMVSKRLFGFSLTRPWIPIHFCASALALILTGIHLGLHWDYLKAALVRVFPLRGIVLPILAAALLWGGCYSLFATDVGTWLAAPFAPPRTGHGPALGVGPSGGEAHPAQEAAQGQTSPDHLGRQGEGGQGLRSAGRGRGQQPFSLMRLAWVAGTTFSMIFLFAFLTHRLEALMRRRRSAPVPAQ